jgi:hypothetical protein
MWACVCVCERMHWFFVGSCVRVSVCIYIMHPSTCVCTGVSVNGESGGGRGSISRPLISSMSAGSAEESMEMGEAKEGM